MSLITRNEIRKQVRRGWVSRGIAAVLFGFDLDLKMLDSTIEVAAIKTKMLDSNGDGEQIVYAHDVLSHTGKTLDALLDKYLPIDRHKRDLPGRQFRVLETATARECFRRQWDRIHRRISKLIAMREENLNHREWRLLHQLLVARERERLLELRNCAVALVHAAER
jgi:hypothetical protein